jgi:nucleotide-binding universal stress UspA family protein
MTDKVMNVAERAPQTALRTSPASIMVYVDFDAGCNKRIKIAADWAAKFNAALIGVAGWLPGREAGGWFAAELERAEDRTDRISAEMEKLGESFRTQVGRTVQAVEWRGSFHLPREVIPTEARAADLVIIGSRPVREDVYRAFDPGTVILNAGRPVLVVPDEAAGSSGERVLVAWKDSREARHAVQSALPYLKVAKHVSLVEIAEGILEWAARNQLDDVERYLLRHGVKVGKKSVVNPEGSASDQLVSIAKGDGMDLIVAGAYGHTRLGEWVFGGVTRGLLERSDICCLFSN